MRRRTVHTYDGLPGVRREVWDYDNSGQPESVDLTWEDGDTVTTTDPALITALEALPYGQETTWSFDDSGQPESVSITRKDGKTITVTEPASIAILKGR